MKSIFAHYVSKACQTCRARQQIRDGPYRANALPEEPVEEPQPKKVKPASPPINWSPLWMGLLVLLVFLVGVAILAKLSQYVVNGFGGHIEFKTLFGAWVLYSLLAGPARKVIKNLDD